jgi:ribonuclease T2
MPNKQKPSPFSHLSPTQLLLLLFFVLAVVVYQFWTERNSPAANVPSIDTAQQQSDIEPAISSQEPVLPPNPPVPSGDQPPTDQAGNDVSVSDKMSQFDYFLLALSWSPDYCATNGSDDPQQCSMGKKLGFGLHGLWPQNKQGYPSNCSTEKLTKDVKQQFPGLYPSEKLYTHEWEKHGTCTGLTPVEYLKLSKNLKESVKIPNAFRSPETPFRMSANQLKQEFVLANPGFTNASFEVNCSGTGRFLKELYVCLSRQGEPAACGNDVHKDALRSCQKADFLVRNIR